jgi:hypothetical protein
LSVARQIAERAVEKYSITGAYQCGRGLAELSMDWMTAQEQDDFEARFAHISLYAANIDDTMDQSGVSGRWDDFNLALARQEHAHAIAPAPSLRLRPDVTGKTGLAPLRTGVYLPLDDAYGAPQFCWTGAPAGQLLECNTVNDLGLEALAAAGRDHLGTDDQRMHTFVQDHLGDARLNNDPFFARSSVKSNLAASLVARHAFATRPCNWIYVEQLHGVAMDWSEAPQPASLANGARVEAGGAAPQSGYYRTPAHPDSRRHFAKGDIMPHFDGDYDATIWQWDNKQS